MLDKKTLDRAMFLHAQKHSKKQGKTTVYLKGNVKNMLTATMIINKIGRCFFMF